MLYRLLIYWACISTLALIFTVYDKIAAKRYPKHRVREAVLMWISVLGGSAVMLVVMLLIRHKTLHKKFMIGIPLILLLQVVSLILLWKYGILTV